MLGACLYTPMGHADGEAPAAGDSGQLAEDKEGGQAGAPWARPPSGGPHPATLGKRPRRHNSPSRKALWLCSVPTVGSPERDFSS